MSYALQNPGRYFDPTGEVIPLAAIAAGAAIGASLALLDELAASNWNWSCVNWFNVGVSGAIGAAGGAYYSGWAKGLAAIHRKGGAAARRAYRNAYGIAGRGTEVHHGVVRANGVGSGSLSGAAAD